MPTLNVAGFGSINFPDTMSAAEIQAALDRMRAEGKFGRNDDDQPAGVLAPAPAPALAPAPGLSNRDAAREAKRRELARIATDGDVGRVDLPEDPGVLMPALRRGADAAAGWTVGLAERAGLVESGTRQEMQANLEAEREASLLHGDADLRAVALAGGELAGGAASAAVPGLSLGRAAGVVRAASPLARAAVAGGLAAAEGSLQTYGDTAGTPDGVLTPVRFPGGLEVPAIALGAGLGAASGLAGVTGGLRRAGDLDAAEAAARNSQAAARIEAARRVVDLDPAIRELESASQQNASRAVMASYEQARRQLDIDIDNALAANAHAAQRFPGQVKAATPEETQAFRERRYQAFDREWNPIIRDSASKIDDPVIHELADKTEPPSVEVKGPKNPSGPPNAGRSTTLVPQRPRWASSVEDGFARLGEFAARNRGRVLSPSDLPFRVDNIALTRWEREPSATNPRRQGATFWLPGDSFQYRQSVVDADGDLPPGGNIRRSVDAALTNPLIITDPDFKLQASRQNLPVGDVEGEFFQRAQNAGHDAVILVNEHGNIEVVTFAGTNLTPRQPAQPELNYLLAHRYRPEEIRQMVDLSALSDGDRRMLSLWERVYNSEQSGASIAPEEQSAWLQFERDNIELWRRYTAQGNAGISGEPKPSNRLTQQLLRPLERLQSRRALELPEENKPRFSPSERGSIGPFGRQPQPGTPKTPGEQVIRYDDIPREPLRVRLQKAADRFIDEFSDKEDAPIRLLRRADLPDAAKQIERYIGRARGASRIAKLPLFKGVYKFDPTTGNTVRTYDSLNSVIGGLDETAERDLNDYMAARHHMELVARRDRAQLEADIARAARLNDLRSVRRADKESLQRMAGDIRSARAQELQLARRSARAGGQAESRLSAEEGIRTQAAGIRSRGRKLEQEAAAAARRTQETGFDQASAEFAVAAQYARRLLREELKAAVATPRQGSTAGLTPGAQPRSPSALDLAEANGRAFAAVAEKLGLEEGQARALVRGGRQLEAGARGLDQLADRQGTAAAGAFQRQADADRLLPGAADRSRYSIGAAQRVAMGIRDQATKLYRQHQKVEPHPDAYLDIDEDGTAIAKQIIGDIEQRYGVAVDPATGRQRVNQLDDIADGVRSWSVAAVIDQLDSIGYFKPGQREALLAAGQEYAPFFRLLDEVESDPQFVSGGTTTSPIKRISGGLSPKKMIAPPLESFVSQSQKIAVWVERQRVKNLLGDFAEAHPDTIGAEVKSVAPGTNVRYAPNGTFTVFRDGQRVQYTAPAEIMSALDRSTPKQASLFLQAGVAAARLLRAGATLTPDFAIRNFLRDQVAAGSYGVEFKYRPFSDFAVGLWAQMPFAGKDLKAFVEQWEASGGALSDYISIERPAIQLDVRQVRSNNVGTRLVADWRAEQNKFVKYVMYPVLKPLETVSSAVEQGTRIGAYRRAKLAGATDLEGGFYSRNITLDFGRSGSLGQRWNSVEAFANASLQDVARFSRSMRERPVATTVAALSTITVPALAAWAVNKDDPEYNSLPEWEKAAFLHVAKRDDGRWVRIPRPQGMLNLVYGYGVQKMLEAARGELNEPVNELLALVFSETPARFSPIQPDPSLAGDVRGSLEFLPSALQPAVEAAAGEGGWSSFRQAPIVPDGMQDSLLPQDRVGDTTTAAARAVGRTLGVAPLKVDHLIRGYGAGLTYNTIQTAEKLTGANEANSLPQLPQTAKDIPGVGGLISTSSYGFASKPVQDLYALERQAAAASGSLKSAAEQGRVFEYQRILKQHPEIALAKDLTKARRELKELRDFRRIVRTDPGLQPEQRADMLLQIDQMVTQIAAGHMHVASDFLRGYRANANSNATDNRKKGN